MDEKNFLLKICCFMKCIVFINHLWNKKLLNLMQNGFKKLIFLLIYICINETILPLILIYENISNDL